MLSSETGPHAKHVSPWKLQFIQGDAIFDDRLWYMYLRPFSIDMHSLRVQTVATHILNNTLKIYAGNTSAAALHLNKWILERNQHGKL